MRSAVLALLLLCLAPAAAGAAAGDVDRRFGTGGVALISLSEASTQARAVAVQPDGRVLVSGTGSNPGGWVIARLLSSGKPDRSFGVRGRVTVPMPSWGGEAMAIEVMPDGRIVVGGDPTASGNSPRVLVARLLEDGKLDPSWGEGGIGTLEAPARQFFGGMAVQPDGGVAVASSMHLRDQQLVVMRLGPDGRPDRGFADGGAYVDPEPSTGTSLVARPDGGLIAGGALGSFYGPYDRNDERELLVALTPDGRPDTRWGRDGRFVGPLNSRVTWLERAPEGGVVALDRLNHQPALLWLKADGSRREQWGLEGRASASAIGEIASRHAVDGAGQVYVAGAHYGGVSVWRERATLVRIDARGVPTLPYGGGIRARLPLRKPVVLSYGLDVAIGPGRRILMAASGADRFADDREDYGSTHAMVGRFKGWEELVTIHRPRVRLEPRRRISVYTLCEAAGDCRMRAEVRDRRGKRIARASFARRQKSYGHTFGLTPSRPLRRGEWLTVRVSATSSAGEADTATRRFRVPPRRRR